ncbi:AWPM-19-like family protein [Tasmannia lanceolata]|uniref:AWPM-19-like family protein n=1 Tax=Tasmannia lanceolata TaxID=3420 RepID=UPI0040638D29
MAYQGPKSLAFFLLVLNLILYAVISMIAGWAINFSIEHTHDTVPILPVPAHIFPIYFPMGNMATAFFVIFALIAGLVGIASSVSGINSILRWDVPNLLSAGASSIITWGLTLLAMGLACKEINVGRRNSSLIALETLTIILSGTQLICAGAIHSGAMAVMNRRVSTGGRG